LLCISARQVSLVCRHKAPEIPAGRSFNPYLLTSSNVEKDVALGRINFFLMSEDDYSAF
jgi:hypothetical protein